MHAVLLLLVILLVGCAGNPSAVSSPVQPDLSEKSAGNSAPQYQLWASGAFQWDASQEQLRFLPDRDLDAHFNVWPLLNPPNCVDCVALQILSHDVGQKLLTVQVTLRNPTGLSGWFVRGLVETDPSTELELLFPDGWWHGAWMAETDPPAAFMTFAKDQPDMEFGPGRSHVEVYQFHYGAMSDFSKCTYRVIVRFPKEPGEVTFIGNDETHGAFTSSGGFVSLRADMIAEATAPVVTMKAVKALGGTMGDWMTMREEPDGQWLTWFPGEATSVDEANLWIVAEMEGTDNALAYRVDVPVQNVVPEPNREFPVVESGVGVFVDQLSTGMTEAQKEFMATHAVGSQKLVKHLADEMRAYNPEFIVVQYHLAFGEGDISNIYGNDWVKNWEFVNGQEDFFEHRSWSTQPYNRVLQQDWAWDLTDPESEWVLYFIGNTIERMDPLGDQFDGVFADSASQPWNTDPSKWWEGSDDAHDMFTYWTPKTQYFFDTVAQAYHTLPTSYYLIPNAGSYVTTISDITYFQCDGIMIEGFGHWGPGSYFTEEDWRLQQNRTRAMAVQDKIILAQTSVDPDDTVDRGFVQGSYFLLQDNFTYFNMLGPWGLEPQWWPEYLFDAGPAVEDWTDISELQDMGGCYVRHFDNGIVIVNPSDETRYYTTEKMYSHTMVGAGGLLPEDGVPTGIATGPLVDPGVQEIDPYSSWLGIG